MNRHTLLLILSFYCFLLNAQDEPGKKKVSFTPLPIILFDPYTGLGYGALVNANFLLGDSATTRVSNAQVLAMHTTRNQTTVQGNHQMFFEHEKLMWQGKLQFLDWPEYTYQLGARTDNQAPVKELISYQAIEFEERLLWKIGGHNFIGPQYRLFTQWNTSSDQPDSVSFYKQKAIGNTGFVASGIGLHYVHDSRDNVQNAYKGLYFEMALNPNFKWLGSTQQWMNIRTDLRWYHSFKGKKGNLIATRILAEQATGDVPYMITPMPGRYYATRGYVQGRYRGKTYISGELEYRKQVFRRWGVCCVYQCAYGERTQRWN